MAMEPHGESTGQTDGNRLVHLAATMTKSIKLAKTPPYQFIHSSKFPIPMCGGGNSWSSSVFLRQPIRATQTTIEMHRFHHYNKLFRVCTMGVCLI